MRHLDQWDLREGFWELSPSRRGEREQDLDRWCLHGGVRDRFPFSSLAVR